MPSREHQAQPLQPVLCPIAGRTPLGVGDAIWRQADSAPGRAVDCPTILWAVFCCGHPSTATHARGRACIQMHLLPISPRDQGAPGLQVILIQFSTRELPDRFSFWTRELPDRNRQPGSSRIDLGAPRSQPKSSLIAIHVTTHKPAAVAVFS